MASAAPTSAPISTSSFSARTGDATTDRQSTRCSDSESASRQWIIGR
jgi:hypothetical protein